MSPEHIDVKLVIINYLNKKKENLTEKSKIKMYESVGKKGIPDEDKGSSHTQITFLNCVVSLLQNRMSAITAARNSFYRLSQGGEEGSYFHSPEIAIVKERHDKTFSQVILQYQQVIISSKIKKVIGN